MIRIGRGSLRCAPAILLVSVIALDLWSRARMIQLDSLAIGHYVGPVSGTDTADRPVTVSEAACHLIRFASSQCPACRADQKEWMHLRSAMIAKGCNTIELAPAPNLIYQDASESGVYQLKDVGVEFTSRTHFNSTPTVVLTDRGWRVIWSQRGALDASQTRQVIANQPSSLLQALLKPVELHWPAGSNNGQAGGRQALPMKASLDSKTVDLPLDGSPAAGPVSARVTVVEFADFQCPFCALAAKPLLTLREKFPQEVRLVFKQFPLEIHPMARRAAELSLSAGNENFWKIHDQLFRSSPKLSDEVLQEAASAAGLSGNDREMKHLHSDRIEARIDDDLALGRSLGVEGTPTLFIDGHRYLGPIDAISLEGVIADELIKTNRPIEKQLGY